MNLDLRIIVFLPLAFFALAALAFLIFLPRKGEIKSSGIDTLPAFQLAALPESDRPPFSSDDLKQGKVFLVNIWASWCAPCRAEHPLLMALSKDQNIIVAGMAYRDEPENALRFLERFGNPYDRIGLDATGRAALGWGIYGVPESFVINGAGRIILHHRGPITDLAPIRQALQKAQQ